MIRSLNKFYLRGGAKAAMDEEALVTRLSSVKGMFGHFCGLDSAPVFVCVQTHSRMVLPLSRSSQSEWPCVLQKNTVSC